MATRKTDRIFAAINAQEGSSLEIANADQLTINRNKDRIAFNVNADLASDGTTVNARIVIGLDGIGKERSKLQKIEDIVYFDDEIEIPVLLQGRDPNATDPAFLRANRVTYIGTIYAVARGIVRYASAKDRYHYMTRNGDWYARAHQTEINRHPHW